MFDSIGIQRVRDELLQATCVCAFTGAGISVESGIPDFRGREGIWRKYPVEDYGTLEAFRRDPERFWRFYFELVRLCGNALPNPAHRALARLEQLGRLQYVITQNVDGLHQAAGSSRVIEVHGQSDSLHCLSCGAKRSERISRLRDPPVCPRCGAMMKPDVVLFGEELPWEAFDLALDIARRCEVCLIVGTSGGVYPAARIPEVAFESGATLCQFDVGSTVLTQTGRVHHFVEGPASRTLVRLAELVEGAEARFPTC